MCKLAGAWRLGRLSGTSLIGSTLPGLASLQGCAVGKSSDWSAIAGSCREIAGNRRKLVYISGRFSVSRRISWYGLESLDVSRTLARAAVHSSGLYSTWYTGILRIVLQRAILLVREG